MGLQDLESRCPYCGQRMPESSSFMASYGIKSISEIYPIPKPFAKKGEEFDAFSRPIRPAAFPRTATAVALTQEQALEYYKTSSGLGIHSRPGNQGIQAVVVSREEEPSYEFDLPISWAELKSRERLAARGSPVKDFTGLKAIAYQFQPVPVMPLSRDEDPFEDSRRERDKLKFIESKPRNPLDINLFNSKTYIPIINDYLKINPDPDFSEPQQSQEDDWMIFPSILGRREERSQEKDPFERLSSSRLYDQLSDELRIALEQARKREEEVRTRQLRTLDRIRASEEEDRRRKLRVLGLDLDSL